jgi:hypothetical protein
LEPLGYARSSQGKMIAGAGVGMVEVGMCRARGRQPMYACKSGRHYWYSPLDADKCCDPELRRVLVVAQPADGYALLADVQNITTAAGVSTGRQWVHVDNLAAEGTR